MSQQTMTIDEGLSPRTPRKPNPSIERGVPPSGERTAVQLRQPHRPGSRRLAAGHDPALASIPLPSRGHSCGS
jgi:hypothetical protein